MQRREAYATSGTRPIVRFFAGGLRGASCGRADMVERAYRDGVPMGGEMGAVRDGRSPRFLVMAAKDPGVAGAPGAALDRIQIVKGWADATGTVYERVYDVAAGQGGGVDPATCEPGSAGTAELCAEWEDPDFDPGRRAFYYVRVLEAPTCRWSTRLCRAAGVDPLAEDCAARAAALGSPWEVCCWNERNDPFLAPLVQERAWTSPVWYRPDAIASLRGTLERARRRGRDALALSIRLASTPAGFDPAQRGMVVRLHDDRPLLDVTVPPGAMRATRPGRWRLPRAGKVAAPLSAVTVRVRRRGQVDLKLRARRLDLSGVAAVDHAVHVELEVGAWRAEHQRRWRARRRKLVTP
jgi:hypothetical protein